MAVERTPPGWRFLVAVVAVGGCSGVAGAALTLLLHAVQHLAYGYDVGSFLVGAQRAPGWRRVVAMTLGGVVTGTSWWLLRRGRERSRRVERLDGGLRPVARDAADACTQIVAVGAGASLGREGAPRQVGAAVAGWLAARLHVADDHRAVLRACGAGAALAAVYNVPLAGALYTAEVLRRSADAIVVVPALGAAAIATVVAWPVVTDGPTYQLPGVHPAAVVVAWAAVASPLLGLAGTLFAATMRLARRTLPDPPRLPITVPLAFAAVGLVAVWRPEVLGNGKAPAQLAFAGALTLPVLLALVVLKPLATAVCLRSGATGGLLTPAIAFGAVTGSLLGQPWASSPARTATFAVIGAAGVLAVTQRAPLTAVALVVELTHAPLGLLVPVLLAVAGAVGTDAVLAPRVRGIARARSVRGWYLGGDARTPEARVRKPG